MSVNSISQGHVDSLFNEAQIGEFGVWCSINDEVNPADWAGVCRMIGTLGAARFHQIKQMLHIEAKKDKEDTASHWQRVPVLSLGPSGLGGKFQREI